MIFNFAEIIFAIVQEMLQKVSEVDARSLLSLQLIIYLMFIQAKAVLGNSRSLRPGSKAFTGENDLLVINYF